MPFKAEDEAKRQGGEPRKRLPIAGLDASRCKRQLRQESAMASKSKIAKALRKPKFSHAADAPLQAVRPAAGRVSQVRHLPHLLPQVGRPRADSRREEGELVKGTHKHMMTDPIADMLTRIRNAVRVERPHVDMPAVEGEARPRRGAQARRLHLGLSRKSKREPGQPAADRPEVRPQRRARDPAHQARQQARPPRLSRRHATCGRCSTAWASRSSAPAAA